VEELDTFEIHAYFHLWDYYAVHGLMLCFVILERSEESQGGASQL